MRVVPPNRKTRTPAVPCRRRNSIRLRHRPAAPAVRWPVPTRRSGLSPLGRDAPRVRERQRTGEPATPAEPSQAPAACSRVCCRRSSTNSRLKARFPRRTRSSPPSEGSSRVWAGSRTREPRRSLLEDRGALAAILERPPGLGGVQVRFGPVRISFFVAVVALAALGAAAILLKPRRALRADGRLTQAIDATRQALELATQANDQQLARDLRARLFAYQAAVPRGAAGNGSR